MDQVKIGKFIAQMRKEQNLTQRGLADKLSISDKTVSKWERGDGTPDIFILSHIACFFQDIGQHRVEY